MKIPSDEKETSMKLMHSHIIEYLPLGEGEGRFLIPKPVLRVSKMYEFVTLRNLQYNNKILVSSYLSKGKDIFKMTSYLSLRNFS